MQCQLAQKSALGRNSLAEYPLQCQALSASSAVLFGHTMARLRDSKGDLETLHLTSTSLGSCECSAALVSIFCFQVPQGFLYFSWNLATVKSCCNKIHGTREEASLLCIWWTRNKSCEKAQELSLCHPTTWDHMLTEVRPLTGRSTVKWLAPTGQLHNIAEWSALGEQLHNSSALTTCHARYSYVQHTKYCCAAFWTGASWVQSSAEEPSL